MRIFLTAILVVLVFDTAVGQEPSTSPIATSTPSLTSSPNSLDHVVELAGKLGQRLLTTVYWCLGTVVTTFLILIGYNWFVNFRVHERDFRELRAEISARLDTAVDKIQVAAKAASQELKTEVRKSTESYIESSIDE